MNDKSSILLGYQLDEDRAPLGFGRRGGATQSGEPIYHDGETPLLTIAPTGSGKGTSCIIPTLLSVDQPAIVIDIKGEAFQVTADQRGRMGHEVICIDPFGYTGKHKYTGALNPMDLIHTRSPSVIDDATTLAATLNPAHGFDRDPFWELKAQQIMAGFVLAIATFAAKRHRHLGTLKRLMSAAPGELTRVLRAMLTSDRYDGYMADSAKALMSMPDRTCNSVTATITYMVNIFGSRQVTSALKRTTFLADDLIEGRDITIYLVLPPDKLSSHAVLLRLWLSTLTRMMFKRRVAPIKPCLVLIDECAQLGPMDEIRQLVTLMRGYGVMPWMFFQSLSQLQRLYPDWRTFVENCGTVQLFGFNSQFNADQAFELTGYTGRPLLGANRDIQVIAQSRKKPRLAQLRSYLATPELRNRANTNTLIPTRRKEIPQHER